MQGHNDENNSIRQDQVVNDISKVGHELNLKLPSRNLSENVVIKKGPLVQMNDIKPEKIDSISQQIDIEANVKENIISNPGEDMEPKDSSHQSSSDDGIMAYHEQLQKLSMENKLKNVRRFLLFSTSLLAFLDLFMQVP